MMVFYRRKWIDPRGRRWRPWNEYHFGAKISHLRRWDRVVDVHLSSMVKCANGTHRDIQFNGLRNDVVAEVAREFAKQEMIRNNDIYISYEGNLKDHGVTDSSSNSTTGKKPANDSRQKFQKSLKETTIGAFCRCRCRCCYWRRCRWLRDLVGTEDTTGHAGTIVGVDDEGSTGKGRRSARDTRLDASGVVRIPLRIGGKIHSVQPRVHRGVVVVPTLRGTVEAGRTVVDMDTAAVGKVAVGTSGRIGTQIRQQIGL
jgi:hypothetical protein